MPTQVVEVVPGEYDVTPVGIDRPVRVLVPAGVGLPGVDEEDLARAVVEELVHRGRRLPATLDVSELLHGAPEVVAAVAGRLEEPEE